MLSKITGEQFKNAREQLGISQYVLAQKLGIGRTYLSLFESGRNALTEDELQRLEKYLIGHGWSDNAYTEEVGTDVDVSDFDSVPAVTNEIQQLSAEPIPLWLLGLCIDEEEAEKKVISLLSRIAREYLANRTGFCAQKGTVGSLIGSRISE